MFLTRKLEFEIYGRLICEAVLKDTQENFMLCSEKISRYKFNSWHMNNGFEWSGNEYPWYALIDVTGLSCRYELQCVW